MCTVKHTEKPTLNTKITADITDSLIPTNIITANNCISVATALNTTKIAAHTDNSSKPMKNIAAIFAKQIGIARDVRKSIYCSQNINGMPDG